MNQVDRSAAKFLVVLVCLCLFVVLSLVVVQPEKVGAQDQTCSASSLSAAEVCGYPLMFGKQETDEMIVVNVFNTVGYCVMSSIEGFIVDRASDGSSIRLSFVKERLAISGIAGGTVTVSYGDCEHPCATYDWKVEGLFFRHRVSIPLVIRQ